MTTTDGSEVVRIPPPPLPRYILRLNVGGVDFDVSSDVAEGNGGDRESGASQNYFSTLHKYADGDSNIQQGHSSPSPRHFIGRSPELFRAVLHFLTYRVFRVTSPFTVIDVADELTFYGFQVPLCSATREWHLRQQLFPLALDSTPNEFASMSRLLLEHVIEPLAGRHGEGGGEERSPLGVNERVVMPSVDRITERSMCRIPNAKFIIALACRPFVTHDDVYDAVSFYMSSATPKVNDTTIGSNRIPQTPEHFRLMISEILRREYHESNLHVEVGQLVVDAAGAVFSTFRTQKDKGDVGTVLFKPVFRITL